MTGPMRATLLLLFVALAGGALGCGGGGGGGGTSGGAAAGAVTIEAGALEALLGTFRIDFGPGGAPNAFRLQPFSAAEMIVDQLLVDFLRLEVLAIFLMTPDDPLFRGLLHMFHPQTLYTVGGGGWGVKIHVPVKEYFDNSVKVILPIPGLRMKVDVKKQTVSSTAPLEGTGRIGVADAGLSCEWDRVENGDGTSTVNLSVFTEADRAFAARSVQVLGQDGVFTEIGPLVPDVTQTLTYPVTISDLQEQITLRFSSAPEDFMQDTQVQLQAPLGVASRRVALYVKAWERAIAANPYRWNRTHPSLPLTTGELGIIGATGPGHVEEGKLGATQFLSTRTRGSPGLPGQPTYAVMELQGEAPSTNLTAAQRKAGGSGSSAMTVDGGAALLSVGAWGLSIANFDNTAMDYVADSVVEAGNMTDIAAFGGSPTATGATYVDNAADAIGFITRNAQLQYVLDPASRLTNAAWPGASGKVVSAFRHDSGDLLFVTDGEPGEFWVLKSGDTVATSVGTAGNAPRNIRAAGNIAAIGSYGTGVGFGGLRVYRRTVQGAWVTAPSGRTGPRSVGIDVKQLADGRVAIAYPAYLNHKLHLTVVSNDTGEILFNEDHDLPAGATNPGHCAFVPMDGVEAVLVTCNGSGHLVVQGVTYE